MTSRYVIAEDIDKGSLICTKQGAMSLKRSILCMVLSLSVLVKQNRIPESVHYFSEGGGFSQLRDRPSISFSCASYSIYIYSIIRLFHNWERKQKGIDGLRSCTRDICTYALFKGVGVGVSVRYVYLS